MSDFQYYFHLAWPIVSLYITTFIFMNLYVKTRSKYYDYLAEHDEEFRQSKKGKRYLKHQARIMKLLDPLRLK